MVHRRLDSHQICQECPTFYSSVYLHFLLYLPASMYFSSVVRISENAEVSKQEIERMIIACGGTLLSSYVASSDFYLCFMYSLLLGSTIPTVTESLDDQFLLERPRSPPPRSCLGHHTSKTPFKMINAVYCVFVLCAILSGGIFRVISFSRIKKHLDSLPALVCTYFDQN